MALLPDPASIYLSTGLRPTREGNRNPALTPAEAFPTADGWLNVVLLNPPETARVPCGHFAVAEPFRCDGPRWVESETVFSLGESPQ